jgi:hypothetical protein
MKTLKCLIVGSVALLSPLTVSLHAQTAEKVPMRLQASVGDVTDNRTTSSFSSECKVQLKFTGDTAADAASVRAVRVTEARDELGRDLLETKEDSMLSRSSSRHHGSSLQYEVAMRNPSRNAAVIKVLKGEVELFTPTETNGAILTIKDLLKHPVEPVQNPVLSKYGITFMYLTKASCEAKKKELAEQQKSAGTGMDQKLGEAFGQVFQGMLSGMMSSDSANSIQLYIKDPEKRILSVEFQDAQGKALKTRSSWTSSEFQQTELTGPPPSDTQVVLQFAVPEAVKSFPFELHDIPLP